MVQQVAPHQSHHDAVSEIEVGRVIRRPRVHGERQAVPGEGVAEAPQLDVPLHRLLWHVLLPCQPPVEADHRLVNRQVLAWSKTVVEVIRAHGDERPHLRQFVAYRLLGRE